MALMQLGNYVLLDLMGKGGMAEVYRARDEESGRVVAIKVFEAGPERTLEMARRLRDREVRMLVSVQHPNIVKFYDMGEQDGRFHYAMEFVENSLLKRMRKGEEFSLLDKVHILRQTANALTAMHHQGIVHRDVKPGNILLDQEPAGSVHAKLTDLGIAKSVSETDVVREQIKTSVPGTAKYLCPEQIRLEPVDGRADVFSLGVVAYQLLCGRPPFPGHGRDEYLRANVEEAHKPLDEAGEDIPPFLSRIVDKMLVKDREERYDSDTLTRDLDLVYQHLVSGADLVEEVNPASIFYEPSEEERRRARTGLRAIAPLSWAAAVFIVVAGLFVAAALWPERQAPAPRRPPVRRTEPPPADEPPDEIGAAEEAAPTPADIRAQACEAADAGRYWHALALLGTFEAADLDAELEIRQAELVGRVQNALAGLLRAQARKMLAEDRTLEVSAIVVRMREHFPEAEPTRKLDEDIRRHEQDVQEKAWRARFEAAGQMAEQGRYLPALDECRKMLADARGDADHARAVRNAAGGMLDAWCGRLLDAAVEAGTEEAEDFLRFVESDRNPVPPGRPSKDLIGALHVKLARIYCAGVEEQPGLFGPASAHCRAAIAAGGASAGQARGIMRQLLRWKNDRDTATLLADLAGNGFRSARWVQRTTEGASRALLPDGGLQLAIGPAEAKGEACIETPPIRPAPGLSVNVKVRAARMPGQAGASRAGVEMLASDGTVFQLAFDGRGYRIGMKAGGVSIREAFGDEAEAWHTLGLEYDREAGRVRVSLDGQEAGSYAVSFSDLRVAVFLRSRPGAGAEVRFKDIGIAPLPD